MWGPMWGGGWGMPWGMFFMPFFFLICIGFMFYFFRHGFPFGGGYHIHSDEQSEELRKLRQEVEELRKELKR